MWLYLNCILSTWNFSYSSIRRSLFLFYRSKEQGQGTVYGWELWEASSCWCSFHGRFVINITVATGFSCCSVAQSYPTLCDPMNFSTPGFSIFTTSQRLPKLIFITSWRLLKLMSIESVMPSNHLILYHRLLLLLWIFPSIRVFPNESALRIRWPKFWSSALVLPMNIQGCFPLWLTGLISMMFKGPSRVFSSTTVWKHQFFGAQSSL